MAEVETNRVPEETVSSTAPIAPSAPSLKYLGFLPIVIVKVTTYVTALYGLAKDNCGPLKPGVDSMEGTVKKVVGPIYEKIEGKPFDLLVLFDRKVGDLVRYLDGALPQNVKDTGNQALDAAKSTVSEVQAQGIYTTARGYYEKYEPVAESYGVEAYKKAITFPLVPQAISCTRFAAVKVNDVIVTLKDNGLPLAGYLPLLPVSYFDKITTRTE